MLHELSTLAERARSLFATFDPTLLDGASAREAVRHLAELERLAGAAKVLAAGRLMASGAGPGDDRFRDVDAWLASLSGTSVAAARSVTAAGRSAIERPATADALRSGRLSATQATIVGDAVRADPGAERRLLKLAETSGLKGLRAECDRVVAAGTSRQREQDAYERIRANRALRVRSLPDGGCVMEARGPADRIAQILAALEPFERARFDEARRTRQIEHPEAHAFDALVALAEDSVRDAPAGTADGARSTRGSRGGRPLATFVLHVSHAAYERGWTERGEFCEIEGVGPVPVAVARRVAADSIIKAVVTDGVDVTRVAHLGRSIPAHLRTAVETRDRSCVIAGCEVDRHLEIDHNEPVAIGGPTSLENLGRICHHHHDLKTRRDLRRVGPLGSQRLVERAGFGRLTRTPGRSPPALVPA